MNNNKINLWLSIIIYLTFAFVASLSIVMGYYIISLIYTILALLILIFINRFFKKVHKNG